jgi:hypothetical protein
MSHEPSTTEQEHQAGIHTTHHEYCYLCREERREYERQEMAALKIKLEEARTRADTRLVEKEWVIKRIDEELMREGISLQWTDGGGSACPSGWHRNPYLNWGRLERVTRERDEALSRVAELNTEVECWEQRIDELEEALARAIMCLAETCGYLGPFDPKHKLIYSAISAQIDSARKVLNHPYIEQQLVRNMKPDRSKDPCKRPPRGE